MNIERQSKKTLSTRARHLVRVQHRAMVHDGEGGFIDGWADRPGNPVWADISPLQAWQRTQHKTVGVDISHRVSLRGGVDVAETDRIIFGARRFEVLSIENIQERGIEQVVMCKEDR